MSSLEQPDGKGRCIADVNPIDPRDTPPCDRMSANQFQCSPIPAVGQITFVTTFGRISASLGNPA